MALPTIEQILIGFSRWRELHCGNQALTAVYRDYLERCGQESRNPQLKEGLFKRLMEGKTRLLYEHIPAIFDILQVPCVDLFFDFCTPASLSQVYHFTEEHWGNRPFGQDNIEKKSRIHYISDALPSIVRTRLDRVIIQKQGSTKWEHHNGHEFILVFAGQVTALLSETPNLENAKEYDLNTYEGLAFPSGLYHRVENRAERAEAVIGVARPARAVPVLKEGIAAVSG